MAETTNLPPGGYVVDYSQPNPEANELEAYQYGYMPNAEKFKQYRVERYDPEFGAYVTDIYNADTGQFYATAKGTENKFLDKVVQPIAMAGLAAAIGSAGANLLGLGGAATGAAAGDIAFAAADAAQLAAQGLSEAQIAQTLATTGLDAFVAADMAQLAAQGLGASQIASTVGATAAGTGGSLFNTLSPAQAVAQGVAEFPNAAGATNAAQAAATAATPAATTPAATSGASGLLSGLTPAQISNLLKAGIGLLGAGAASSALGKGTQAISPTSLPQQAPAKYDQNYFDALNAYYETYLPGQEANTSMLQSWYNRQPYQVDQFQMPVMAGQSPQQPVTPQQPTGDNMGFFSNLFGSLFERYLKPNRVTPAAPTPVAAPSVAPSVAPAAVPSLFNTPAPAVTPAPAASSVVPTPSTDQYGFTTGGATANAYGNYASKEEYDRAVAQKAAEDAARKAELQAYNPSAPFLASYFANPETIPRMSGESLDDAILRLKAQDKDYTDRIARRTAIQQGGGFTVS